MQRYRFVFLWFENIVRACVGCVLSRSEVSAFCVSSRAPTVPLRVNGMGDHKQCKG
jgi:hypothetical protein